PWNRITTHSASPGKRAKKNAPAFEFPLRRRPAFHFSAVQDRITAARAAVAWTFGMKPEEYRRPDSTRTPFASSVALEVLNGALVLPGRREAREGPQVPPLPRAPLAPRIKPVSAAAQLSDHD